MILQDGKCEQKITINSPVTIDMEKMMNKPTKSYTTYNVDSLVRLLNVKLDNMVTWLLLKSLK